MSGGAGKARFRQQRCSSSSAYLYYIQMTSLERDPNELRTALAEGKVLCECVFVCIHRFGHRSRRGLAGADGTGLTGHLEKQPRGARPCSRRDHASPYGAGEEDSVLARLARELNALAIAVRSVAVRSPASFSTVSLSVADHDCTGNHYQQ